MARPLHLSHHQQPSFLSFSITPSLLLLFLTVAAVASIIFSLCTTTKHSKHTKNHKPPEKAPAPPSTTTVERKLVATLSGIGSKALVVAKMVSWKRGGVEESEEEEEEVWRKSIMMGEKCRPLDFSGQILYDAEGNEVKKEMHQHAKVVDGGVAGIGSNEKD